METVSFPTAYSTLTFHLTEGIGLLRLSTPPSNKMSPLFFREFAAVINQIKDDPAVKALVISGAGRHFSSGADLSLLMEEIIRNDKLQDGQMEQTIPGSLVGNYQSFSALEALPIPVIAAIRGVCLGSALELALFSHFRFCSAEAVFGLPETTFNLIPGIGGMTHMLELSGKTVALEYILRGKTFDASEAQKIGLVDQLLPRHNLLPVAIDFAGKIPANYHPAKKGRYLKNYFKHDQT